MELVWEESQGNPAPQGDPGIPPLTQNLEADGAAVGWEDQELHSQLSAFVAVLQECHGGSGPWGQEEEEQEEGAAPSHGSDTDRAQGSAVWIYIQMAGMQGGDQGQLIPRDELCPGLLALVPPVTSVPRPCGHLLWPCHGDQGQTKLIPCLERVPGNREWNWCRAACPTGSSYPGGKAKAGVCSPPQSQWEQW